MDSIPQPVPISILPKAGGQNPSPQPTDLVAVSIFVPNKFGPNVGGWTTYSAQLGNVFSGNNQRQTDGPIISVLDTDFVINCALSAAAQLQLPAAASRQGLPIIIKDVRGNFQTFNLTVVPSVGERIDGQTQVLLSINYSCLRLRPRNDGGSGWSIDQ